MVTRALCILIRLLVPGTAAAVPTPPPMTAPTGVDAAAARRLEREAWSRLREGRPEAAAEVLREALRWLPGDPRLLHNLGIAEAQSGAYSDAAAAFRDAAEQPGDPALRARARYNEAASLLLAAQEGAEVDPAAAPRALEAALHATREALAANPEDDDARANGELAWRLLEQLRENTPRSGGDGGDRSPESGDESSGEEPPSPASGGADGAASDAGDQEGEQGSEAGEAAPRRHPAPPEGGEGADASPPPAPPDDGTPDRAEPSSGASPEAADRERAPAPENGAESGASSAPEPEPDAAPDAPAEPQGEAADDGRASGGERAASTDGSRMTPDAAERILQRIRDAERQRREAQRRAERLRQPPVEKDW